MNSVQKEHIRELRKQGESYAKIANALGISINTIKSYCRRNNLTSKTCVKPVGSPGGGAYCQKCGKKLVMKPNQKPQKFCSYNCRMAWWKKHPELINKRAIYHFVCAYCGKDFNSYGNKKRKYCSHPCYIKDRFDKEAGVLP